MASILTCGSVFLKTIFVKISFILFILVGFHDFYVNIQSTCFIATFLYLFCTFSLPSCLPPPISLTVLAAPSWILQPTHVYLTLSSGIRTRRTMSVKALALRGPLVSSINSPLCRAVDLGLTTRTLLSSAQTEGESKPGKQMCNNHWNASTKDSRKPICGSYQCSVLSGMIKDRRSLQNVIWVP